MAYIDSDDITRSLPAAYDTTLLDAGDITDLIAEAGAKVDSITAPEYFPFNAHGSTPGTPGLIKQATRKIALGMALRQLGTSYATDWFERGQTLIVEGLADVQFLMDGDKQLPSETKTGEAITYDDGSPDWGLESYEAFLASTSPLDSGDPPNILLDTVEIAGATGPTDPTSMRLGYDYSVRRDLKRPGKPYIFTAKASELQSATSITVDYQWDYRRHTGDSDDWEGGLVLG